MHKYVINDIYTALGLSFGNFFGLIVIFWGAAIFFASESVAIQIAVVMTLIAFIQSIFIYFANRRYIVDLESGLITFPRSDIENSIIAIILLYSYWNLMRTQTIHASDIENLYLDTERWTSTHRVVSGTTAKGKTRYRNKTERHVRYNITIAGTFGSASLMFTSRQKRDEVRNALQQCVKKHGGKNIDRKIAEFS